MGRPKRILTCTVPGCGRPYYSTGCCAPHYGRLKATGDVRAHEPIRDSKHGAGNPRWTGGEITDGRGRVLIYTPSHPRPSWCGTHVYRYRLVMEKHLGRFLQKGEVVHHVNGNHADDCLENLKLMSQSEHCRLHAIERHRRLGHKIHANE